MEQPSSASLPAATAAVVSPASLTSSAADRSRDLGRPAPASSSQGPRLYAPLLSLLNPVEDSADTAAATSRVEATQDLPSTHAGTDNDADVPPTVAARARSSPSAEPLLSRDHGILSTSSPVSPSDSGPSWWWSGLAQVRRDMQAACAREVLPVDQPRPLTTVERAKMARYESVDTYEPESMLYKDYLETRSHEPRWFMWVFVLALGIGTSALSLGMAACLHVLNSVRYELLGFGLRSFSFTDVHRYANHTVAGSALDVWAMLKGHNVGLYGVDGSLGYGAGYAVWLLFALCASAVASGVCYLVPESVGSGIPEVKAYLNGVSYPMMRSTRVLVAKVVAVVFTVASGVCTGHYGLLMLAGAMLGAQLLQRRHGVRCYHVHFVDCFRNPRDRRVILVIGAAAGMASAFCVSVGGLLVILELLSAVFPVRFALYVFAACLLSTLCTQVYLSYWVNFDTRYRPSGSLQRGELLSEAVVLFGTHLPFGQHPAMNLMDFVAAFLIGLCTGICAVLFVRVSWAALYLRRRLEVALGTKAIRYVLPIVFTLLYVSLHYWIAVAFTYEPLRPSDTSDSDSSSSNDGAAQLRLFGQAVVAPLPAVCRGVPYAVRSGRNVTTISFDGMNGFLCPAVDVRRQPLEYDTALLPEMLVPPAAVQGEEEKVARDEPSDVAARQSLRGGLKEEQSVRVVDSYASLAFAYADSTLQTLLSQRTAALLPLRALSTFTVVYFFSSAAYSGLALCGDTLLPSLVIGAALGRCIGTAVHGVATRVDGAASSWADPGVFALFGAGSFVSATSGLSFGIGATLIESTADFRHLLPLMFAILVARRVLARWSRDVLTVYLEARAVPLLNAEPFMDRFPLLDARDVMHGPVVTLPVVCSLENVVRVLRRTTHHGFPVVSLHDGTCKGIVTRAQLEVLLWHLVMTQGRVSQCTYDVLQRVEDHVFHHHWEGRDPTEFLPTARLQSLQVSLYPHVDTSAFTALDTTAVSCVYDMFTTLGLRHLIVVDRSNCAVGMITRKDLTGDHLTRVQESESHRPPQDPQQQGSADRDDGTSPRTRYAAAVAVLRAPLHPSAAQVAAVARTSSVRRLHASPDIHAGEELHAQAVRRGSLLHLTRPADGTAPAPL